MSSQDLADKDRKRSQQEASGCENPFVPVTSGSSNFSRFKQLSTRRSAGTRTSSSPNLRRSVSGPKHRHVSAQPQKVAPTSPAVSAHTPLAPMASAPPIVVPSPSYPEPPKSLPLEFTDEDEPFELAQPPAISAAIIPPMFSNGAQNRAKSSGTILETVHSLKTTKPDQGSLTGIGFSLNPPTLVHSASSPAPVSSTAINKPMQSTGLHQPYLSPTQWTILDETQDHPGRRKHSGFFQPIKHLSADPEGPGCCALLLALVSILLIIATLPFSLCMCIKVVQEYERSVIFRLGRLRKGGAKGPGIFFIIPCIDTYRKVDLRTVSFDVPPQEVLSRDSVTVTVDAVVYYRVSNPTMATNNVEDFSHSTHLLAATTLRNVLGTKHLAEILSERETISHVMEQTLDEATDPWGVKVERVEIKDVRLPVQLQRAMAAEAEAAREARAKVIAAEGEQKASRALREASDVISESPSALQLRYLQTLNTISAEKNSTIIFPVPLDIISHFFTGGKKQA
ncbi:uncharacterized protein LOC131889269 isoform X3 [Tigriopus californicus]|uniref:uncharacterized protein LOC131889269 isoform X3 n=1 Tax=Tigriopus californicus TaxID=6832 RepID=UPI0027DA1A9C|nr:uncharacterized protein LOC131889269 isoform X3 [Tigriopus californicus]